MLLMIRVLCINLQKKRGAKRCELRINIHRITYIASPDCGADPAPADIVRVTWKAVILVEPIAFDTCGKQEANTSKDFEGG